jgi:MFS family permease
MNLGLGIGAAIGGTIAHVASPDTFTVLFVLDAVTFLAYVGVIAFIHDPGVVGDGQTTAPASYTSVVRDRLFVRLWTLNFLFVAAGYSLFNLVPPFARDHAHVSETQIGLFFFVNTGVNVVLQLPISRAIEGRRRMRALALMPSLWVVAWLLLDGGAYWFDATPAFVAMTIALAIFGVGECFHGPCHQALVAEIAPDHLRGRYFAVHSLSWGLAGTVGPAVGGFLLAAAPFALWPAASAVCACAAVGVLALERLVPRNLQRIPHPVAEVTVLEPVTAT